MSNVDKFMTKIKLGNVTRNHCGDPKSGSGIKTVDTPYPKIV